MFQKGNTYAAGKKSGGRKTIKEEVEAARELITQEALIALANSKVYKQLQKIQEDNLSGFKDTQAMALPITLKGFIERKDITSGGKPIPLLEGLKEKNDTHDGADEVVSPEKKN